MCSLQFVGLLGDAGIEFCPSTSLKPRISLDAEDLRRELRASLDADLDAEDLLLGTYRNPLFASHGGFGDVKNAFPSHSAAWPRILPEAELLCHDVSRRPVESRVAIDVVVDEDAPAGECVTVTCGGVGGKASEWYVNQVLDETFWETEAGLAGDDGEGERMLRELDTDEKGLAPPGWSAPILIDRSSVGPIGGALAKEKVFADDVNAAARMRNPATFIEVVKAKAENVARGLLTTKPTRSRPDAWITDPLMDEEVRNFDFSTLDGADTAEASKKLPPRRQWVNTKLLDTSAFDEMVPHPAVTYPFELDEFQKQAVLRLEMGENVFVAAHTSAGKTVVAEYAIGLAQKKGTRVLYTSPIKTLSNQKYNDFKKKFGDVGILTGDVQLNPDAAVLVLTTEILRSMLYRDASILQTVEYVVFDEVHYVNDAMRGHVWEEVIILLPRDVRLVMLSATVPNVEAFADWVGRTRESIVHVVSTFKRPVPLRHSLHYLKKEYPLMDASRESKTKGFDAGAAKEVYDACSKKKAEKGRPMSFYEKKLNERREWREIIRGLEQQKKLPAIVFAFSKAKLDSLAEHMSELNFTNKMQKVAIETFCRKALKHLKGSDKAIPQVTTVFRLLKKGVAVHHAGLIPLLKEIVEVLFCKGFIKVLFATETFAMGVNAPARSVVFASTQKFDGTGKRDLTPGEYIQMSGRAGRRGLDPVGHVLIACINHEAPSVPTMKNLLTHAPQELESKFRLTYAMVLNVLTNPSRDIAVLLRNSFSESRTGKYYPVFCSLREKYRAKLEATQRDVHGDFEANERIYDAVKRWVACCKALSARLVLDSKAAQASLPMGTVILVETAPMVLSLGYVLKLQGFDDVFCYALCNTTDRQYNAATLGVPVTAAAAPLEEIVLKRNRIVCVLAHNVLPQVKMSALQTTGKAKDKKVMPVFAPQANVSLNDKEKLREMAEKLRELAGRLRLEDVVLPPRAGESLEQADSREDLSLLSGIDRTILAADMDVIHNRKEDEHRFELYSQLASDDSLFLMPEFKARLDTLANLGMVAPISEGRYGYELLVKGKCAKCITNMDAVIATELMFEGFFDDLDPQTTAAMLSCFVCSERSFDRDIELPRELKPHEKKMIDVVSKLWQVQNWLQIGLQEYLLDVVNIGICEAVWEWAHGAPFTDIIETTKAREGSLIRDLTRLDGLYREFKMAARKLGDTDLAAKFDECSRLIRRDVVFSTSLYLTQ
ncbi:Antiviral helicase SKI2 [Diplonema papillatum]|nr:Antiviral helicase SKI2 [Diplonema papillatum]